MASSNQTIQLTLGNEPQALSVLLSPNAVWNPTMTATDSAGNPVNWPVGTTCAITFSDGTPDATYSQTYSATVSGANISWTLTAAQVNSIISAVGNSCAVAVYLDQSGNGSAPTLWLSGTATVRR